MHEQILALYAETHRYREVARRLGLPRMHVREVLQAAGVLCKRGRDVAGEANPNWAGGQMVQHGYVRVLAPDHPYADVNGYVAEHRLVMEGHLGRYLEPHEEVHHRNEVRDDNRLENLELTTKPAHARHHRREKPEQIEALHQARRERTHCKRGHAFAEHAYVTKDGRRDCQACRKLRGK